MTKIACGCDMKFYFTSQQIPGLRGKVFAERAAAIEKATNKFTVPEKMLLNLIKLMIFIPAFVLILRISDGWIFMLYAILVFLLYPFIIKPVQYTLCAKYMIIHNK